ncbi:cytochrome P450 94A1 [Helianthus annuus]|nr:cytochrome P450 94A1 [Helianthus annuus]
MFDIITTNLLYLLILSLPILLLSTIFHHLPRHRTTTPCPQSYPLIGNLIGFLRNRHRFHDWVTDMLSTTPSLTLQVNGFLHLSHGICTANPTNLHHLLRHNFLNYIKGHRYTTVLHELLGNGIFNSDGDMWSSQRKVASHEFKTKALRVFISDTVRLQISNSLVPYLLSVGNCTVDLQLVLKKFGFDNICNVAFGVDPCLLTSGVKDPKCLLFVQAFDVAVEHTSYRFMSPLPVVWKLKRFFNIGSERKYKEAIETVNEFAMEVIKSKETQIGDKTNEDLLSRFMASSWDMGFEDEERRKFLRDIIISFILAGKDSTSTALTWFFWLLDGHPHCKHMIHKEISMLMTSTHHIHVGYRFDDLKNLYYLHAALSESMRLFPPVPINSRLTVDDDILPDGTFVGKGWFADYSAYAMGRMERLWGSDCREFKPERWLDDDGMYQQLDQYKYPVFHGGFRMCLGKEMAYLQMKSVVVAVMHEFEIEVVGGGGTPEKMVEPPYSLSLLLNMKNGLHVRLKKRQQ